MSRTIGADRLVDEMVFRLTHTMEMDWLPPGVPRTGKPVEIPPSGDYSFSAERQAGARAWSYRGIRLPVLGATRAALALPGLPVCGAQLSTARKVWIPGLPSNQLMRRAWASIHTLGADLPRADRGDGSFGIRAESQ